eukprot:11690159-Ditylum_brightwellii.AAC.1
MGIAGGDNFWVFSESQLRLITSPETVVGGTDLARGVHGSAIVGTSAGDALLRGTRFYDAYTSRFSTLWGSDEGVKYLQSKLPLSNVAIDFAKDSTPSNFEPLLYEAVVALCLASCDTFKSSPTSFFTANDLFQSFTKTTFEGLYGPAFFDSET